MMEPFKQVLAKISLFLGLSLLSGCGFLFEVNDMGYRTLQHNGNQVKALIDDFQAFFVDEVFASTNQQCQMEIFTEFTDMKETIIFIEGVLYHVELDDIVAALHRMEDGDLSQRDDDIAIIQQAKVTESMYYSPSFHTFLNRPNLHGRLNQARSDYSRLQRSWNDCIYNSDPNSSIGDLGNQVRILIEEDFQAFFVDEVFASTNQQCQQQLFTRFAEMTETMTFIESVLHHVGLDDIVAALHRMQDGDISQLESDIALIQNAAVEESMLYSPSFLAFLQQPDLSNQIENARDDHSRLQGFWNNCTFDEDVEFVAKEDWERLILKTFNFWNDKMIALNSNTCQQALKTDLNFNPDFNLLQERIKGYYFVSDWRQSYDISKEDFDLMSGVIQIDVFQSYFTEECLEASNQLTEFEQQAQAKIQALFEFWISAMIPLEKTACQEDVKATVTGDEMLREMVDKSFRENSLFPFPPYEDTPDSQTQFLNDLDAKLQALESNWNTCESQASSPSA